MAAADGGLAEEPLERQLERLKEETGVMLSMHQEGMRRCIDAWSTRHQQLLKHLAGQLRGEEPLADCDKHAAVETNPSLAIFESEGLAVKAAEVQAKGPPTPTERRRQAKAAGEASDGSSEAAVWTSGDTAAEEPGEALRSSRVALSASASTVWLTTSHRHTSRSEGSPVLRLDVLRRMTIRELAQVLAASGLFQLTTAVLILINVVLIGVETNYFAVHGEAHLLFHVAQTALLVYFMVELMLRGYAWGISDLFLHGEDRAWNIFDLALIITCFCDTMMQNVQVGGFVVFRMVRVCRLLRLAQVVKLLGLTRYFQEIRKIFLHLAASMRTLFWSLLWVVFVIYVFAVLFTTGTTEYLHARRRQTWGDREEQLHKDFGTVTRSIYSLYTAITGGRNWGEFMGPLSDVGWIHAACFAGYVTFCFFGVLNIVTSVFVECAMQSTQRHRDLLVEDRRAFELGHLKHMRAIFKEIDMDESGTVEYEELKNRLSDSVALQDYFNALELNATDTLTLFELLDQDGSGELSIDEFVDGCMRLKGEARSFDINCLIQESRKTSKTLGRFSAQTTARIDKLSDCITELRVGLPHMLTAGGGMLLDHKAPRDEPWDPFKWTQLNARAVSSANAAATDDDDYDDGALGHPPPRPPPWRQAPDAAP